LIDMLNDLPEIIVGDLLRLRLTADRLAGQRDRAKADTAYNVFWGAVLIANRLLNAAGWQVPAEDTADEVGIALMRAHHGEAYGNVTRTVGPYGHILVAS
jgi:hypothetical protein